MRHTKLVVCSLHLAACFLPAAGAELRYELREVSEGGVSYLILRDKAAGIEARVAPEKGGELCSLRVFHNNRMAETLYRACDYSPAPGWSGRAPLLWPATGRNFARGVTPDGNAEEGSYDYQGRRLPIPLHGFARLLPWKVESRRENPSAAAVVLSLADTPGTRRSYPFAFRVEVEYRVTRGRLEINHTIHAGQANREPMFFSIGNHITFRTPFAEGSDPLAMTFESPSSVEYLKDGANVPTGESKPRSFAAPSRLGDFKAVPAISLGGYQGNPWMRLRDPSGLAIRLEHSADSLPAPPVIQFNVWGDAAQGYFSPEPWVGLQNSFNLKQGLVTLAPGKQWGWRLRIEPERP